MFVLVFLIDWVRVRVFIHQVSFSFWIAVFIPEFGVITKKSTRFKMISIMDF